MSGGDQIHILGAGIVHGDKVWHQVAAVIHHGKIFLMMTHGSDQNLGWDFQKFLIELARGGNGVFHQVFVDIYELLIRQHLAADVFGRSVDFLFNKLSPFFEIDIHFDVFQGFDVIFRRGDLHFFGLHKIMTERISPALCISHLKGNDLTSQKGHNIVDRSGEEDV